jgi:hypothetical protein
MEKQWAIFFKYTTPYDRYGYDAPAETVYMMAVTAEQAWQKFIAINGTNICKADYFKQIKIYSME